MTNTLKVRTDRMKKLIELHGLTETAAAEKAGVTRPTWRRAMAGENVSAGFVAGACLGFQVPFDSLFYAVGEPQTAAAA